VRDIGGDGEHEDGNDSAPVSEGKSVDDVGGGTSFTGSGNFLNWFIAVGSVIFGNVSDDESRPKTGESTVESVNWFSVNISKSIESVWEGKVTSIPESGGHEDCGNDELSLKGITDSLETFSLFSSGEGCGNNANDDTEGTDEEGIVESSWLIIESWGVTSDDEGS